MSQETIEIKCDHTWVIDSCKQEESSKLSVLFIVAESLVVKFF